MFEKLPPKVLVVEKDELFRTTICNTIERYWFSVIRTSTIEEGMKKTADNPNVVIISSKFGSNEVIAMVKDLQKNSSNLELPLIILLEDGESKDNYSSISSPLTEFMNRPFTPNELMLCIKGLLRKSNPIFQDKVIKYKDLSMDLATYRVYRGSKQIHLGPTEFKIMQMLILAPRTIHSRQSIMDHVWGKGRNIESRTVDVHVNRIRSLIKLRDDEPPIIKTVRSSGYCLNLPGEKD